MKRLLIGALLFLVPGVATAATFVVNSTVDAADAAPGDGVCAAAFGACTLRAAVQEANALAGAHVITLPAGMYILTLGGLGVVPGKSITISGAGQATTMVDGNSQHGVFTVSGGALTLGSLTVQHGVASDGAGIFVTGAIGVLPIDYPGSLTLNDATITQNVSTGTGGGVSIRFGGSATINRTTITSNSTASGGGIYFAADSCVVASSLSVTDSTIAQNISTGDGGGLSIRGTCDGNPNASISRSTISGNSAVQGGGTSLNLGAVAIFVNTTVSGNTATTGSGGAIVVDVNASVFQSRATFSNVTVASNSSAVGGAVQVFSLGVLSVTNTIIADSAGMASANCAGNALVDFGHNLEYPGTTCSLGLASDLHTIPYLIPLSFRGGPTQTHALPGDSAAIDAGDDAQCPAVDQRGVPRPVGSHCDIGSVEYALPTVVTGAATDITSTTATLHGTANPNGTATTIAFFEYTTAAGDERSTPGQLLAPGRSPVPIGGGALNGLACATLYSFHANATNQDGAFGGGLWVTFTTAACLPPTVTTGAAGPIHSTGANIQATVNPNGAPTTITVEYGPTTSYGSTSLPLSVPAGTDVISVARRLTGLHCNTLYHYRAKAANASVAVVGVDATFTSATCGATTPTLLWRHKLTGQNVAWHMDPRYRGTMMQTWASLPTVDDMQWTIQATGDIDGDGQQDIVWRNSATGQITAWFLNGGNFGRWIFLPTVQAPDWTIRTLQDFDGDGNADLLWHNTVTGQNVIWFLNGTGVVRWAAAPTVADLNWEIANVGDFDGDGQADLLWRNKATGVNVVWLMDGASLRTWAYLPRVSDLTWTVAAVGDLDGDGHADILWRNAISGQNVAWFMNGATMSRWSYVASMPDRSWVIARVTDLDGDGAIDLLWRNQTTGQVLVWLMNAEQFDLTGLSPSVTDLNWNLVGK